MKKFKTALLVAMLFVSTFINGQPPRGGTSQKPNIQHREKVEAMKVAYLTRRLNITAEEGKAFWPVYNAYQDDLFELREKRRKEMQGLKSDDDKLSEKDFERIFNDELLFRQSEVDLMRKYHEQMVRTLPFKKLARLHGAEEDFKRELLSVYRDRMQGDGQRPAPGKKGR